MEIELLKPWLRKVSHDENLFFCSFCNKSMVGGLSQIYRHAESKAHIEIPKKHETETKNMNESINIINDSLLSFDERKKTAEIRYAALIADKNISHQTAKEILSFFQHVGKDPNVLQNMSERNVKTLLQMFYAQLKQIVLSISFKIQNLQFLLTKHLI